MFALTLSSECQLISRSVLFWVRGNNAGTIISRSKKVEFASGKNKIKWKKKKNQPAWGRNINAKQNSEDKVLWMACLNEKWMWGSFLRGMQRSVNKVSLGWQIRNAWASRAGLSSRNPALRNDCIWHRYVTGTTKNFLSVGVVGAHTICYRIRQAYFCPQTKTRGG